MLKNCTECELLEKEIETEIHLNKKIFLDRQKINYFFAFMTVFSNLTP